MLTRYSILAIAALLVVTSSVVDAKNLRGGNKIQQKLRGLKKGEGKAKGKNKGAASGSGTTGDGETRQGMTGSVVGMQGMQVLGQGNVNLGAWNPGDVSTLPNIGSTGGSMDAVNKNPTTAINAATAVGSKVKKAKKKKDKKKKSGDSDDGEAAAGSPGAGIPAGSLAGVSLGVLGSNQMIQGGLVGTTRPAPGAATVGTTGPPATGTPMDPMDLMDSDEDEDEDEDMDSFDVVDDMDLTMETTGGGITTGPPPGTGTGPPPGTGTGPPPGTGTSVNRATCDPPGTGGITDPCTDPCDCESGCCGYHPGLQAYVCANCA